jgi:hypothetical protein
MSAPGTRKSAKSLARGNWSGVADEVATAALAVPLILEELLWTVMIRASGE